MTEFPTDTLAYPEPSKANTVLILAILGIAVMPVVLSPIAWAMGRQELKAIDAGRRSPEGRKTANLGMRIGMVATSIYGLIAAVAIVFLVSSQS